MSVEIKETEKKNKLKTQEEIEKENSDLLAAFEKRPKPVMNKSKLEELKEKLLKKEIQNDGESTMPEVITKQEVSINMAMIGVGQAGSRVAESFHKLGYDVGVINTSSQDLAFIDVTPQQKLLLEGSLGGTGKDLNLGYQIFSQNEDKISEFISPIVDGNDMIFLAISGGGGTGSSSVETMIGILSKTGMPIGVVYVLPKNSEDAQAKQNTVETMAKLSKLTYSNVISTLIVVDNARIETIYGGLSQAKFWEAANKAIVEPIHLFNSLTAQPSKYTSLDPSDFGKIISCGDCSIYGILEEENYMEETALAESIIGSLKSNMLADGFDISQTRVGGVIIIGSEESINKLPAINIDYALHMISEQTNGASIFHGIYTDESVGDKIKIYSWFAGLGLPTSRIENLKQESKLKAEVMANKEKQRSVSMNLDDEKDKTSNTVQDIHKKIAQKNSGFNRLQKGSIIDKRKK
jgi:cell division GTPase FtsZ